MLSQRGRCNKLDEKKGRQMFDSKEIFDLGFAFLNVGEVSFHEGVIKQRSDYQNVAGVVNLAFACELFIKCMLNMAGMQTHGHDIEELWLKYKNAYGDTASEIESAVMNQLVTNLTFEEMLHNDSNVYYNYRYLYDPERLAKIRDNPLRLQFMRTMVKELYSSLRNKITDQKTD